jgi:hypothetical protein
MSDPLTIATAIKVASDGAKALAESFKQLKEFGELAGDVKGTADKMTKLLGVIDPFMIPIRMITAQIGGETASASMKTMEATLALLETETMKTALQGIIDGINWLLGLTTTVLTSITNLMNRDPEQDIRDFRANISAAFRNMIEEMIEQIKSVPSRIAGTYVESPNALPTIEETVTNPNGSITTHYTDGTQHTTNAPNGGL